MSGSLVTDPVLTMTDDPWADTLAAQAEGPYFFAAEAVLPFLVENEVRDVVDLLAENFPGSLLALDTAGPGIIGAQEQHDALSKVEARMQWACADPAGIRGQ